MDISSMDGSGVRVEDYQRRVCGKTKAFTILPGLTFLSGGRGEVHYVP